MSEFINSKGAKASFLVVGVAVIAFVMFLVVTNSKITASSQGANMVFTEDVHDFGTVPQGPEIIYNFKFKNTGSSPLKIEKITSSCGCTAATTGDKKEFTEGESGDIKVTFNTRGREGAQKKTLMVFSNDSKEPQKVLTITCNIDPNMK